MADLQQLRSHEALNTTAAGKFSVADASSGGLGGLSGASISAAASGGTAKHFDIASDTHQLLLYSAADIYFHFKTSDVVVDEDIAPILPGGSLTSIAVPLAIRSARSDTIRFSFVSTSTATPVVRIVEV
tara:strand:+ start:241 stop:627 length:387 start_codon:yes stop_codon:yes gene_type:complete